jgi:hypothetical protein
MTINPPIKIRSFDSWKTINLRLSVFIASAIDLSEYISWSAVFEGLPDVQNSQPKIGLTEAAGELGDGQLVLRTSPGRADLIYQQQLFDSLNAQQFEPQIPVNVLESFTRKANLLLQKLRKIPDIQIARLAFGAELLLPMPDKQSAYTALNDLLHSVDIDQNSSDFQYFINRKRNSNIVKNVEINRLSQWSALVSRNITINQNDASTQQSPETFACRLILDINTIPTEDIYLPLGDIDALYAELVQLGKEIAEFGDIP